MLAGNRHVVAALGLTLLLGLTGCGSAPTQDGGLRVVATTTQIGDFARRVAGDRVTVTQLLPPATDPHEFEPTPKDVQAIASASVVLENGRGLDDWLDQAVDNAGGSATRVVTTSAIPSGDHDPHVWLDPDNAAAMVRAIDAALSAADPAGASIYHANATAFIAELAALDADLRARIDRIPKARRKIVTDHDGFGWFARRYGITVVGTVVPSLSTAAEPSARQLAELTATIRREGVRVVFAEASINPRVERALADEAGVALGAPLYGDALGPPDTPAGTYLGMMRANMDAIVTGIGPA